MIAMFLLMLSGAAEAVETGFSLPLENASFEAETVDPNGYAAIGSVDGWTEIDLGPMSTGVFVNVDPNDPRHISNAHESQLAFINGESGTALEQFLDTIYQADGIYRLTVAVGISATFPPSVEEPLDTLDLVLYYDDGNEPNAIAAQTIDSLSLSATELRDVSVSLPPVDVNDPWLNHSIGIGLRTKGAGGFWNLDHVRLDASLPALDPNKENDIPIIFE
jgi:hypothetical protein